MDQKITKVPGLVDLIAAKRQSAVRFAQLAEAEKWPRIAHQHRVDANELAQEAQRLIEALRGNVTLINAIEQQIAYLQQSTIKSRYRSIALTHLEEASNALRREIGFEGKNHEQQHQ